MLIQICCRKYKFILNDFILINLIFFINLILLNQHQQNQFSIIMFYSITFVLYLELNFTIYFLQAIKFIIFIFFITFIIII